MGWGWRGLPEKRDEKGSKDDDIQVLDEIFALQPDSRMSLRGEESAEGHYKEGEREATGPLLHLEQLRADLFCLAQ